MSATSGLSRHPSPLPSVLTPLLGRVHESDQLRGLILNPANRLITVTGPGGVGKTRLALQVGSTLLDDLDDNIVFAPLASIRDADLVLPAIGQAFGVFSDTRDAYEERLLDALQGRQSLLVLDNFEQVLSAAPAIAAILGRCPQLTMLITSQAALGIPGEQLFPLSPLPTPSPDQTTVEAILQSDAVALFFQRARAVNPHLTVDERMARTVAEICRRLDGLPLAIELAAARINILSPDALLARLSNRLQVLGCDRWGVPDRLRTMRHAIAWSYDLLTAHERALFRRLSVFTGGFSLEAVETMFRPSDDERSAYDVLGALVDHSLVQTVASPAGETRFLILETLRDFGLEQLALEGEDDATRLAHAAYFLTLAETAEPHLVGSELEQWLDRLDLEGDNLRGATDWCLTHAQEEAALRIVSAIWRYCAARGLATERRSWLERALTAPAVAVSPYRAKALIGAGNLAEDQRDLDAARAYFDEAATLAGAVANPLEESRALAGLGTVAHDRGEYAVAHDYHCRAAALARQAGDQRSIAVAVGNLAAVSYFQGELIDAERYWEEASALLRSIGDTVTESSTISNLAVVALDCGEYERAEQLLTRALELQRRANTVRDIPVTLVNLGDAWLGLGDFSRSHDCYQEAIHLFHRFGYPALEGIAMNGAAKLALAEGDTREAASLLWASTELVLPASDRLTVIDNAELLAFAGVTREDYAVAAELLGATAAIRQDIGAPANPMRQTKRQDAEKTCRVELGAREYERHAFAGGKRDCDALIHQIRVVTGDFAARPQLPRPPVRREAVAIEAPPHDLTNREMDVLRLLAQGCSTREISAALFISPRTTGTHIANILGKLQVPTRTAAVAYAMRTGLV